MSDQQNQNQAAGQENTQSREPAPVPYTRFAEVNTNLQAALGRVKELEQSHGSASAKWQTELEKAQTRIKELEVGLETERLSGTIRGAGLTDPDAIELVRAKYSTAKTDKGERPEFEPWFQDFIKEKPWLQAATGQAQGAGHGSGQAPRRPPAVNAGARDFTAGKVSATDIANMSEAEWKAHRASLLKR